MCLMWFRERNNQVIACFVCLLIKLITCFVVNFLPHLIHISDKNFCILKNKFLRVNISNIDFFPRGKLLVMLLWHLINNRGLSKVG